MSGPSAAMLAALASGREAGRVAQARKRNSPPVGELLKNWKPRGGVARDGEPPFPHRKDAQR